MEEGKLDARTQRGEDAKLLRHAGSDNLPAMSSGKLHCPASPNDEIPDNAVCTPQASANSRFRYDVFVLFFLLPNGGRRWP